ncbi:holin (3TMs family) [Litoreibacter meonggei]|uniref:Holin (3TMs family) n=1 Tax=Litoreibacter meonggei TaxID=1049199 RepID=A0A497VDS0_9RHOB|nr:holin family protein [Litoreibacter meonggei]RLJ41761.1 holin (3TMs family) [Litoreibacter meonggei]
MGLISQVLKGGLGGAANAVVDVAEVFRPNATRRMELGHDAFSAALSQHGAEFQYGRVGWFDRAMNGLNRLPRPMLALGTLGLFIYAMVDPLGFAGRMQGLAYVPEPLWWLLGAIVSFYFGARELHYRRGPIAQPPLPASRSKPTTNPALEAWRAERGG